MDFHFHGMGRVPAMVYARRVWRCGCGVVCIGIRTTSGREFGGIQDGVRTSPILHHSIRELTFIWESSTCNCIYLSFELGNGKSMGNYSRYIAFILIVSLLSISFILFAQNRPPKFVKNSENTPISKLDLPIHINGNLELSNFSIQGNGSQSNPYIIENKIINGSPIECIWISNTTAFFILRNCLLYHGNIGISLFNVSNGHLINNTIIYNRQRGISLSNSFNCIIANNTLESNGSNLQLFSCKSIIIFNNTILNGCLNICLYYSLNTSIIQNTLKNSQSDIDLHYSKACTLSKNIMYGAGLHIEGNLTHLSSHNADLNNFLNGRLMYYYSNKTNLTPANFTDASQIILVNCNNSKITNANIYNVSSGVALYYSHNNTISHVTTTSNDHGIYLEHSANNAIANNTANYNKIGIFLWKSLNNTIFNNSASYNRNIGLERGIELRGSHYNMISNNTVKYNSYGLYLDASYNNTIVYNTANSNYRGLSLHNSANNSVLFNIATNNSDSGIQLDYSYFNTLFNNSADHNKYGIILGYSSPYIMCLAWPLGTLVFTGESNNNTLSNNTCNYNQFGISLFYSSNNSLSSNIANYNVYGLVLGYLSPKYAFLGTRVFYGAAKNNVISNHTLKSNTYGISLSYSAYNSLLFNNISDNEYYGILLNHSNYNSIKSNILYGNAQCIREDQCVGNSIASNDCQNRPSPIPGFPLFLLLLIFIPIVFLYLNQKISPPFRFRIK